MTFSNSVPLLVQGAVALCKATAGMGLTLSVSPCIGGTCPFIIFESADIDSAVDEVIAAAFKKRKEVIHVKPCSYFFTSPQHWPHSLWPRPLSSHAQVQWVLCVQESVLDRVVARLKLRMEGMSCVGLSSEADRTCLDAVVLEAQQQGAKVSWKKMGQQQQTKNVKSVNLQVSLKSTFFFFCFSWFSPVLPLSQVLSTPPQWFVVLPPPHLLWSLHVLARCCLSWPSGATLKQWPWVRNRNPSFHHTNTTTIIMRWEEMYLFCHLMLHQQETTPVCVWTGNHSPHGLAASIWTEDLTLALEMAKR